MKTQKKFFSALITASLIFSFSFSLSAANLNFLPPPDCNFNVSILFSGNTNGGVILKVVSDGDCGFTDIDPSQFGIVWAQDDNTVLGTGSNLIFAPYGVGVQVTVKSMENGATAKAWFQTPNPPVIGPTLIDASSLPGISTSVKTKDN